VNAHYLAGLRPHQAEHLEVLHLLLDGGRAHVVLLVLRGELVGHALVLACEFADRVVALAGHTLTRLVGISHFVVQRELVNDDLGVLGEVEALVEDSLVILEGALDFLEEVEGTVPGVVAVEGVQLFDNLRYYLLDLEQQEGVGSQ